MATDPKAVLSVSTKSVMKGVKKRMDTAEQIEAEKKETTEGKKEKWILNKSLPRCRQKRTVSKSVLVLNLPSLRDAAQATRSKLLIKKLRLCSYVFEFSDKSDSPQEAKEKEVKRAALLELVNYLTVFKPSFTEEELKEMFEMLACNLFRPLPASSLEATGQFNPEEDEPQSESTWPHLQVVYEFLLRLATSTETDSKLLDKFFSRRFVLNLLELFDSEDPRERDYLKTILHRIYGNFMSLRPFIRKAINNVFFRFMETDRNNGIAELLEILGSIINGFALPLKEQHKQFLQRVLLPLHKTTYLSVFHPQLSYCVTQFLEKDAALSPLIIHALLKYWPMQSSKKALMFLNETEEILDRVQAANLGEALVPLFKQIAKCINSPHFQISERAIYILNNDVLLRFVTNNREILIPILSKALYSNTHLSNPNIPGGSAAFTLGAAQAIKTAEDRKSPSAVASPKVVNKAEGEVKSEMGGPGGFVKGFNTLGKDMTNVMHRWQTLGHWNSTIVELTNDILKLFNEMDQGLMQKSLKQHEVDAKAFVDGKRARRARWSELCKLQTIEEERQLASSPNKDRGVDEKDAGKKEQKSELGS